MNYAVIEAQTLIEAGDIAGAEYALATLADKEGDRALVLALDEMPAKDLLAIIREYDASKESVINLLVTPEQFAKAVVLERRYGDQTHEQLRGMINSVIFREDADTIEFLYQIGEVEGGYDVLADYLMDRAPMVEHFYKYATFDLHEQGDGPRTQALEDDLLNLNRRDDFMEQPLESAVVEDHDWMQVTYLLRNELPEIFREVLMKLRARYREYLAALALEEAEEQAAALGSDEESLDDRRKAEEAQAGEDEESAL